MTEHHPITPPPERMKLNILLEALFIGLTLSFILVGTILFAILAQGWAH